MPSEETPEGGAYFRRLVEDAIAASAQRQAENEAKIRAEAEAQRWTSVIGAGMLNGAVRPILEEAKLAFEEAGVFCTIEDNFSAGRLPPLPRITFQCVDTQAKGHGQSASMGSSGSKAYFVGFGETLRIGIGKSYSNHPETVAICNDDVREAVQKSVERALQSYLDDLERRKSYLQWSAVTASDGYTGSA